MLRATGHGQNSSHLGDHRRDARQGRPRLAHCLHGTAGMPNARALRQASQAHATPSLGWGKTLPRRRQLRIDTCHAVFGLGEDFAFLPLLGEYQLIVVDEISQLDGEQCDRIMRLREMVDNVPALAFMGDRWQMAGFGEVRPWDTRLWQASVHRTTLVQPYRCQDSTKA